MTTETSPARSFKDRKDRNWDLTITFAGAKRIDNSDYSNLTPKKFSFLRPGRELFTEILTDGPIMFAMAWALVQPQAQALNIDEDEFLDGLDGPSIAQAKIAFWGAISDFFPDHQTALLQLMKNYQTAEAVLSKEMEAMGPEIAEAVQQTITEGIAEARAQLQAGILKARQDLKTKLGEKSFG